MSSNTKNIYEQHVKPLSREQRLLLLDILQTELDRSDDSGKPHSILELHGLGGDIWQGIDPQEYVTRLREEWDERVG